jgi:hypothetical protein
VGLLRDTGHQFVQSGEHKFQEGRLVLGMMKEGSTRGCQLDAASSSTQELGTHSVIGRRRMTDKGARGSRALRPVAARPLVDPFNSGGATHVARMRHDHFVSQLAQHPAHLRFFSSPSEWCLASVPTTSPASFRSQPRRPNYFVTAESCRTVLMNVVVGRVWVRSRR